MYQKVGGDVNKVTNIKLRRNELGLTQFEVALKAGISYRGYQSIEAGERLPNVLSAQRIAHALNSTVEKLFPIQIDKE